MKLEQSFEVAAPLERVWKALIDVEQVAPCLPGAAIEGRNDDGSYKGSFTVKIGPTTAAYRGKLEMRDIDEGAHTATMHAQGSDKRGQGGATATIVSNLDSTGGDRTRVEVVTDYHITGRLARFGRGGMIEEISQRLLRQFADRLQASLVAGEPAAAATGPAASAGPAEASGASEAVSTAPGVGEAVSTPPGASEAVSAAPGASEPVPAPAEDGAAPAPTADGAPAADETPVAEEAPTAARAPAAERAAPAPSLAAEGVAPAPPPAAEGVAPAPPAEPIRGLSLLSSVVWGRVRRDPFPYALSAGLLVALVAVLLRRNR